MCSFLRRHVRDFSKIAAPLYNLLKKDRPFVWTEREQNSFDQLKQAICAAPALVTPDPTRPYVVHTDASDLAIGAILLQRVDGILRPIAFHSRKLNEHELNYPVHEKEALAIVDALKTWKQYVEGSEGVVFTDHAALAHFKTQPVLTRRQTRWAQILATYDCDIRYIPGEKNRVADALSRRPDYMLGTIHTVEADEAYLNKIRAGYVKDPETVKVLADIHTKKSAQFEINNGLIYVKNSNRLYIPDTDTLHPDLVHEYHDINIAGHLGNSKTYANLSREFYWPNMWDTVQQYISSCEICQRTKSTNQSSQGLLQSLPIPDTKWAEVSMDLVTDLPKTDRGYDAIVVFVDRLTKRIHVAPCTKTTTAEQLAYIFFALVWKNHGMCRGIVTDRDTRFTSRFWQSLF